MTTLAAHALAIILAIGQPGDVSSPASPPAPADRLAILKQALADYDSAMAVKNRSGPEAQQLFRRALSGFESLLNGGVANGPLYYNVANTYLRLGDVGRAVVNYRRALRLARGDERISKNLSVARGLCRLQIPAPAAGAFMETLFFWHFGTSLAARLTFALAGYALFWLLLLLRLFALRGQPVVAWTIRAVAAVTLIVGASVSWEVFSQRHQAEGVVVADEAVLRKGNGDYYEPQLDRPLSAGVEFTVLENRQDVQGASWYLVGLPDGKKGWLRADQADII